MRVQLLERNVLLVNEVQAGVLKKRIEELIEKWDESERVTKKKGRTYF